MPTQSTQDYRFAFLIGAMKCGTSSLFRYLEQHPDIVGCKPKEVHFFTSYYDRGLDAYLDTWPADRAGKMLLDGSTSYTKLPAFADAATRIAAMPARDKRFIYVMRNPLHRIESHHTHREAHDVGSETLADCLATDHHVIQVSRYAMQLDAYYRCFPPDTILLLSLEEIRRDTQRVLDRVLDHLGLAPYTFAELDRVHNASNSRLTSNPVGDLGQRHPWLRAMGRPVPSSVKGAVARLIGKPSKGRIRLTAAERERALDLLRADLERLRSEYGFDTSIWNLEPRTAAAGPSN